MTLTAVEFLRRFLLHVLPRGFVHLRHYGLCTLSHVHKLKPARHLPATQEPSSPPTPRPDAPTQATPWHERFFAQTGIDGLPCCSDPAPARAIRRHFLTMRVPEFATSLLRVRPSGRRMDPSALLPPATAGPNHQMLNRRAAPSRRSSSGASPVAASRMSGRMAHGERSCSGTDSFDCGVPIQRLAIAALGYLVEE